MVSVAWADFTIAIELDGDLSKAISPLMGFGRWTEIEKWIDDRRSGFAMLPDAHRADWADLGNEVIREMGIPCESLKRDAPKVSVEDPEVQPDIHEDVPFCTCSQMRLTRDTVFVLTTVALAHNVPLRRVVGHVGRVTLQAKLQEFSAGSQLPLSVGAVRIYPRPVMPDERRLEA